MSAVLDVNNTHESIRSPSLYSVVRSEKEGGGLTIWKASVDGKATHGSISDYIFAHGIRMRNDYDNTTKGGRRKNAKSVRREHVQRVVMIVRDG